MQDAETLWADFARPTATADDYIASLRGRRMSVFFMGERVDEPVDHPVIRPSINAMAETYRLASHMRRQELITLLGGAAVASRSRIAAAQQDRLPPGLILRSLPVRFNPG